MKPKITEVQIVPVKPQSGLIAFTSFVLDDCLYLTSVGIMTRPEGGYRLTYPTRKIGTKDMNIFYPINKPFAEEIERSVFKKFEEVMKNDGHSSSSS